jgi:hypothetical protein
VVERTALGAAARKTNLNHSKSSRVAGMLGKRALERTR